MKRLLLLWLLSMPAFAQTFTTSCEFRWDDNRGSADGYRLYFDGTTQVYQGTASTVACGALQNITLSPNVTYTFHLVVYDSGGEGNPSTVVKFIDENDVLISEGQPQIATYVTSAPDAPDAPGVTP